MCFCVRSRLGRGVSWSLREARVGLACPHVEGTSQCAVPWGVAGGLGGQSPGLQSVSPQVPIIPVGMILSLEEVCYCSVGHTFARVILCAFKKGRLTSKTYMNFVFLKRVDQNICGLGFEQHHAVS